MNDAQYKLLMINIVKITFKSTQKMVEGGSIEGERECGGRKKRGRKRKMRERGREPHSGVGFPFAYVCDEFAISSLAVSVFTNIVVDINRIHLPRHIVSQKREREREREGIRERRKEENGRATIEEQVKWFVFSQVDDKIEGKYCHVDIVECAHSS